MQVVAVARLGLAVIATFACVWAPFLVPPSGALAVLSRLAPLRRGLFEDYVANFWCATSPLIKWKQFFSQEVRSLAMLGTQDIFPLPYCCGCKVQRVEELVNNSKLTSSTLWWCDLCDNSSS